MINYHPGIIIDNALIAKLSFSLTISQNSHLKLMNGPVKVEPQR